MCVGAAITPCFGNNPNSNGFLNPLLGGEGETIQSGLLFNPVEFDGIKVGVVELFPDAEKFQGIAITQPVSDEIVRVCLAFFDLAMSVSEM